MYQEDLRIKWETIPAQRHVIYDRSTTLQPWSSIHDRILPLGVEICKVKHGRSSWIKLFATWSLTVSRPEIIVNSQKFDKRNTPTTCLQICESSPKHPNNLKVNSKRSTKHPNLTCTHLACMTHGHHDSWSSWLTTIITHDHHDSWLAWLMTSMTHE